MFAETDEELERARSSLFGALVLMAGQSSHMLAQLRFGGERRVGCHIYKRLALFEESHSDGAEICTYEARGS